MKRLFLCIMCLMFLTGCGGKAPIEDALQLRSDILNAQSCEFGASVAADYGDVTYSFDMTCKSDREGNITFEITKPESIRGISGIIDNDGGKLTFDESILGFELLADGLITPASAPWFFMTALRSGYLKACEQTEEGIHIIANDTYAENAFQVEIYTDNDMIPIHSDIFWKGCRIVSLSITNFMLS